jgi:hypothetical protein
MDVFGTIFHSRLSAAALDSYSRKTKISQQTLETEKQFEE